MIKITKNEPYINNFSNWFTRHCQLTFIHKNSSEHSHVSDFLNAPNETGITISNWNSTNPIFISAQTGTGKNYFLINNLIRPLLLNNLKKDSNEHDQILLISNRVALSRQSKLNIAKVIQDELGEPKFSKDILSRTADGIDNIWDFGDITIYSYQQLSSLKPINYRPFKYVIFDECHFFTSDSTFNPHTDTILNNILALSANSIRIYMSATPEVAFEPIIRKEDYLFRKKYNYPQDWSDYSHIDPSGGIYMSVPHRLTVLYYDLGRNYDYITPITWSDQQDLLKRITTSKEKWLIFVGSKIIGKNLETALAHYTQSVLFLSADNKGSKAYQEIINSEKFPVGVDILISTSVLDNGININDASVKNIVIDVFNRIEFIQMLGRLRNTASGINLYIHDHDINSLKKQLQNYTHNLLDRLDFNITGAIPQKLENNLFEVQQQNINPLSIYELSNNILELQYVIESTDSTFSLILNGDYKDKQARVFNYFRQHINDFPYSNIICAVLKDIKKKPLYEDTKALRQLKIYNTPSFLQSCYRQRIESLTKRLKIDYEQITSHFSSETLAQLNNETNLQSKLLTARKILSLITNHVPTETKTKHNPLTDSEIVKLIEFYSEMSSTSLMDNPIIQEQLRWIELDTRKAVTPIVLPLSSNYTLSDEKMLASILDNYAIEKILFEKYEKNQINTDSFKYDLINKYGVPLPKLKKIDIHTDNYKEEKLNSFAFILRYFHKKNIKIDTFTKLNKYLSHTPYNYSDENNNQWSFYLKSTLGKNKDTIYLFIKESISAQ